MAKTNPRRGNFRSLIDVRGPVKAGPFFLLLLGWPFRSCFSVLTCVSPAPDRGRSVAVALVANWDMSGWNGE